MKAMLWRTIYAVIAVMLLFSLIPAVCAFVGFPLGAAWPILRLCIGGIAIFYILAGPQPPAPF